MQRKMLELELYAPEKDGSAKGVNVFFSVDHEEPIQLSLPPGLSKVPIGKKELTNELTVVSLSAETPFIDAQNIDQRRLAVILANITYNDS